MKSKLFLFISFAVLLVACEENVVLKDPVDGPAITFVNATNPYTPLDNVTFNVTLGVFTGVNDLKLTHLGGINLPAAVIPPQAAATLPVTASKATFTATPTALGMTAVGSFVNFYAEVNFEGHKYGRSQRITLANPTTWITASGTLVQIAPAANLIFELKTANATLTGVNVQRKVGVNGTYADLPKPVGSWSTVRDTVKVSGAIFSATARDTVFYRIIASSATGSVTSVERTLRILPLNFANVSTEITMSSTVTRYNLLDNIAGVDATNTDLLFTLVPATNALSLSSLTGVQFVRSTKARYDFNDRTELKNAWDAGAKVDVILDVEANDVYIYKIASPRHTKDVYGAFVITSTNRTNNNTLDSFRFIYRFDTK